MPQSDLTNRRILLASHPQGLPALENFRLEEVTIPVLQVGQVLLRTEWLSLDPYMRNLMEKVGPGYAPPVPLGAPMVGGAVSRVVASLDSKFQVGDVVLSNAGWQDYTISDGSDLLALNDLEKPSLALGGLGMTGFT